MSEIMAWHFIGADMRLGHGDGRLVVPGETLAVSGPIELYRNGLHWSRKPIDALTYATGQIVCRVVPVGEVMEDYDKGVSEGRKTLWAADAEKTLRDFCRQCALDVAHLWDMPDITRQYLETGHEDIRTAAQAAARAAAQAARTAAWAARTAAWAARTAAWAAALAVSQAAAQAAARATAQAAAWAAAQAAAWEPARDATRSTQNERLEHMLLALQEK